MKLADLLARPDLALTLLTPDLPASRELGGVHPLEFLHEAEQLPPHALALTSGLWMGRRADRQAQFAREVAAHGAAALIVQLGPVIPRVPRALLSACAAAHLPVLSCPPHVPPHALRRALMPPAPGDHSAVQQELLDALDATGERGLVERWYELFGAPLALFAPWGHPRAHAGPLSPEELWAAARRPLDGDRVSESPGRVVCSLVVRADRQAQAVLVAVFADVAVLAQAWPSLAFARTALAVNAPVRREAVDQERLIRGQFLRELILDPFDPNISPARLEAFGFQPAEPCAVAVVHIRDAWAARRTSRSAQLEFRRLLDALRQAGEDFFAQRGLPSLTGTLSSAALFAWQSHHPLELLDDLSRAVFAAAPGSDLRVGISGAHRAAQLSGAHREAHFAAQSVLTPRAARSFERLDVLDWVAAITPPEQLQPLLEQTLGKLRAADPEGVLLHTLNTYLSLDRAQTKSAARLGVHVNTLRYRLKRIESLLGLSLSNGADLNRLQLVLAAAKRF